MLGMVEYSRLSKKERNELKKRFLEKNPVVEQLEMQLVARDVGNKQFYADKDFRKTVLKLRNALMMRQVEPEVCMEKYRKELVKSLNRAEKEYLKAGKGFAKKAKRKKGAAGKAKPKGGKKAKTKVKKVAPKAKKKVKVKVKKGKVKAASGKKTKPKKAIKAIRLAEGRFREIKEDLKVRGIID